MFLKKGVPKKFTKFTCAGVSYSTKLHASTSLKKGLRHRCLFFCGYLEIFKNSLVYKTPRVAASVFYLNQFKPCVKVKNIGICCVYPADFSAKNSVALIKTPENFSKITKKPFYSQFCEVLFMHSSQTLYISHSSKASLHSYYSSD